MSAVDGAADAVGEQGGDGAVGVVAERELLRGGEPLRDLVGGGLHGEQDEPPGPRPHGARGGVGGLEQADVDGRARVDERRVGLDLPVGEDLAGAARSPRTSRRSWSARSRGPTGSRAPWAAAGAGVRPGPCPRPRPWRRPVTRKVIRRCGGSLSRSKSSGGTRTPRSRSSSRDRMSLTSPSRCRPCREVGEDLAGHVGRGDELAAQVLRQRPDQLGDQFHAQAGYLPGELLRARLVERLQRDVDGDAVGLAARLERVGQREAGRPCPPAPVRPGDAEVHTSG